MAVFIVLWPYLLTTKLRSVIRHNLGHSTAPLCRLKLAVLKVFPLVEWKYQYVVSTYFRLPNKRTGCLLIRKRKKVPHTICINIPNNTLIDFHQICYFGLTQKTWGADCINWSGDCLPFLNKASLWHSNLMSLLSKPCFMWCKIYFGSC